MQHCRYFASCLCILANILSGTALAATDTKDGFLLLSGGTFTMGSPDTERQRENDETQHQVTLSPFYADPYEVTQADYSAMMGTNPSAHKGDNLPVENITWLNAVQYCNALSTHRGLQPAYIINGEAVTWNRSANGYRLLTEAEWEYAARAGTSTIFNTGNQVHSDLINFEGSYPYLIEENYVHHRDASVRTSYNRGKTLEVDKLKANAFGMHNMHGNVSEWVFDYYGAYPTEQSHDPAGLTSGSLRVNRGGGYNDFGKHLRSAYRSVANPIDADPNLGFRLCRNAAPLDANIVTSAPLRIAMKEHPRVLVAVFSYSGNTRRAAEIISGALGADLFVISMQHPYQGNIYEVSQIDLNKGTRPPLVRKLENSVDYDVVILGYPTWWATMPMPVLSFLESTNLKGKIVMPFSSHGGTIFGESISDLAKALPDSYITPGFEFHYSGGSDLAKRIEAWLHENGLMK